MEIQTHQTGAGGNPPAHAVLPCREEIMRTLSANAVERLTVVYEGQGDEGYRNESELEYKDGASPIDIDDTYLLGSTKRLSDAIDELAEAAMVAVDALNYDAGKGGRVVVVIEPNAELGKITITHGVYEHVLQEVDEVTL